jgi:ankyrin repeat protein
MDQGTEKINSSSLPSLTDSRNSSTKAPRSLGKLRNRTNRALVSQSTLKVRGLKLVQDLSGAKPRIEAIERLLKGGADPNTCTNEGESALKLATSKDEYPIVQLLLKYGADSTKLDVNGSSPLEEAFSRGNSQIALALLEKDARLDSGYGRFGTCIQAAARGGNLELCKLVTDRGWYSNLFGSGFYGSALQAGVVSRNREVVEFILDHGADVNVKGGVYGTCIRAAAEDEDLDMCRLLISKGADVNLATNSGETALLSAVTKANFDVCQLLLDAGATITEGTMKVTWSTKGEKKWDMLHFLGRHGGTVDDIQVPYFGTLLQSFASQSDVGKCKILLEDCNVNINANGGHYGTALQAAVNSQSREARDLVRLLLDHGADPNIIGGEFGTATLQTDPAGRVVGPWVPAPWVGSATLMGPHGWVLNIHGDPTHRWVPSGSWVLAWVLGPGSWVLGDRLCNIIIALLDFIMC